MCSFFFSQDYLLYIKSHIMLLGEDGSPFDGIPFSALAASEDFVASVLSSWQLLSLSLSLIASSSFRGKSIVRLRSEVCSASSRK